MNKERTTSSAGSSSDAIEARLQGFEAGLRKDRETARRKCQVATERCNMMREELQGVQATVENLQKQYESFQAQIPANESLSKLQEQVQRLRKEGQFQHTELVHKRQKIKEAQVRLERSEKERLSVLKQMQATLVQRRQVCQKGKDAVQRKDAVQSNDALSPKALLWELEPSCDAKHVNSSFGDIKDDSAVDLAHKIEDLVRSKTHQLVQTAQAIEQGDISSLQRIVAGYRRDFPNASPAENPNPHLV